MIYNNTPVVPDYDDPELDRLYTAITGRSRFRYSAASDPAFRSYADRYRQDGRLAMRDTMGRTAALTGGYASSYAQTAGQQQYGEYLRSLSQVLPQLYGQAYQRWSDEGAALRQAYDLRLQRGEAEERRQAAEYQRGRDSLADQQKAAATAYAQLQDSYQRLYKLISATGYAPTAQELEAAGMSQEQAEALRWEYLRQTNQLPAQPGGGSYEYSAPTPDTKTKKTAGKVKDKFPGLTSTKKRL